MLGWDIFRVTQINGCLCEGSDGILPALAFLEMRARRPRSLLSAGQKPRLHPLFSDFGVVLRAGCGVPVGC